MQFLHTFDELVTDAQNRIIAKTKNLRRASALTDPSEARYLDQLHQLEIILDSWMRG